MTFSDAIGARMIEQTMLKPITKAFNLIKKN